MPLESADSFECQPGLDGVMSSLLSTKQRGVEFASRFLGLPGEGKMLWGLFEGVSLGIGCLISKVLIARVWVRRSPVPKGDRPPPDSENKFRGISVAPNVPLQHRRIDLHLLVLVKGWAGRQLVVGRKAFPLDRRERILEQDFQKILVYSLAVGTVRHNNYPCLLLVETGRIIHVEARMAF